MNYLEVVSARHPLDAPSHAPQACGWSGINFFFYVISFYAIFFGIFCVVTYGIFYFVVVDVQSRCSGLFVVLWVLYLFGGLVLSLPYILDIQYDVYLYLILELTTILLNIPDVRLNAFHVLVLYSIYSLQGYL